MVDFGPFYLIFLDNMNYAICWNTVDSILATSNLSVIFLTHSSKNVKIGCKSAGNQQLRFSSSLVGTSETTRVTQNNKFSEWLAGLIDGDGCFLESKKGYASLEITMELFDLRCLKFIQSRLGGSLKLRSGSNAYRYRLHNRSGLINLINLVNGKIRHSKRLSQFHRLCQSLNLPILQPQTITINNGWFAGFFDADGTIVLQDSSHSSLKTAKTPQLSIRVVNKHMGDVEIFKQVFGGNVYYDRSQNGYYQWSVQSKEDIIKMQEYFRNYPSRSHKSNRIFLINEYFRLYNLRAYREDSDFYKIWCNFIKEWEAVI